MHPAVDFRAMTPNRVWEAADPAGVEAILRQWFEDPDEDVQRIAATEPTPIENTIRVGWLVHISDADGRTSSSSRPTSGNVTHGSTGCA